MSINAQLAQARLAYFATKTPEHSGVETASSAKTQDFFGPDGLTFADVLDAVNPLNHIPIVSDLFSAATGREPSAASRLVGGTLLGGPMGFVSSLASTIFKEATGATPSKALYAAVTGSQTLSPALASSNKHADRLTVASASLPIPGTKAATILDLYGASPSSAHASYRNAQLRPYLTDVTTSRIL